MEYGFHKQAIGGSTSAQNYFKKSDLKQLADMGFDHIRLPVDEKEIFDTNMEFVPATRQLVHDAIAWCKEYNMRLVFRPSYFYVRTILMMIKTQ